MKYTEHMKWVPHDPVCYAAAMMVAYAFKWKWGIIQWAN